MLWPLNLYLFAALILYKVTASPTKKKFMPGFSLYLIALLICWKYVSLTWQSLQRNNWITLRWLFVYEKKKNFCLSRYSCEWYDTKLCTLILAILFMFRILVIFYFFLAVALARPEFQDQIPNGKVNNFTNMQNTL